MARPTITRLPTRTYIKVGEITRAEAAPDLTEDDIPEMSDFRAAAYADAREVLLNWVEVARFNIGTAAVLALLREVDDALSAEGRQ